VITQQGVFLTQESPETLISGSGHFVRCHQSCWVNLKHVQAIGSNHFTMDSGSGIPISRTYLQEAKQRFLHELIHI
jgi:DNA-binding LytR/AlgR family response regulator